jgi:3-oxoacyl-[acyl-carrier protein] reductase
MNLANKVGIVTGGNSGIGAAVARALARAGMKVIVAGRRAELNERVAAELRAEFGGEVRAVTADVSLEEDCVRLIDSAQLEFGHLDVLVNNAGKGGGGDLIAESSTEDFESTLRTNLYSAYWCSREAFKRMAQNPHPAVDEIRGAIINMASVAGLDAWSGSGIYSISKHGMMGLTKALADEGTGPLIRAVAVCPAMVATPMTEVEGPDFLAAEDIAGTVIYLLSLRAAAWPTEVVVKRRGA